MFPIESFASPLFRDYTTVAGGATRALLGDFGADNAAWTRRAATRRNGDAEALARLVERLKEYNRALGVSTEVVERIGGIADGSTRVVITGQQPGVLGGPLMTLHKIEAARALADWLEAAHGVSCLPVYWMGADDADFAEIRELVMLNPDHQPLSTSLPSGAHEVGLPVGSIAVEWLARLWDGLEAFVGGFAGASGVVEVVGRAVTAGTDHAGVTARVVAGLTRGGVAVVDGREPLLREVARTVILDYFDREDEVRASVAAGGEVLEGHGFHAQLSLGPDSGVFLLENGRRVKVTEEQRAEARRRLESDVRSASPGVVLRNLVQDVAFDPVACVLGPAEVAYRAQVRGVYELLGVALPVSYPRLFGTYVPPAVARMVEESRGDAKDLVGAPGEFVQSVVAAQSDPAVDAARGRLEKTFAAAVEEFLGAVDGVMSGPALDKMRKRLADVTRRLEQASSAVSDVGRARALERWPFLESLPDVFARRSSAQERYLAMLTPFLFGGMESLEKVHEAARAHVEAVMDGRLEHVVYSS